MREFRTLDWKARLKRWWLDANAWVDSSIFGSGKRFSAAWESYSAFMDRFKVVGASRNVGLTFLSEGISFGAMGLTGLLALGQPAFREVSDENWLKRQDLSVTFYDRHGNELGRRGIRHDDAVELDNLPDHLIKAVLATEDRRFYEHFGIDPTGLARAVLANARSTGVAQGGSTLTQQLAKNLFLTNERTLERKVKEAFLALWLEARLTKREILKLYLDRAYMGNGVFGVQAAAQHYFGKTIKDISLAEAAMLAGLFKAPSKYAPNMNLPAARARAADVLTAIVDAGFMTEGQVASARRNPASAIEQPSTPSPDYFLDFAFDEAKKLAEEGKFGSERVLKIKTTLDLSLQRHAEQATENILKREGPGYDVSQSASVVMETDGAVKAVVGGRDYGVSQFNRATHAQRQPGSSFKPIVYATALEQAGVRPSTRVTDRTTCVGTWCVNNYSRSFSGTTDLTTALARSYNTIPVQLTSAIGQGNNRAGRTAVLEMSKRLGLGNLRDMTSLPIGSSEVTVVDMAGAFAVFANGGMKARPYAALEVRNSRDQIIYQVDRLDTRPRLLSQQVVTDLNYMMTKVVDEGTGKRAALPGIKVAGKTGTSDEYRNAWFVGFTGNYVAAVWFGNDDMSTTENMTGGSLPAQAFHDIMQFAHIDVELKPIFGSGGDVRSREQVAGFTTLKRPNSPGETAARNSRLSRKGMEVISDIDNAFRQSLEKRGAGLVAPAAPASAPAPVAPPGMIVPVSPKATAFRPLEQAGGPAPSRLN